jgi:hypothetical protein
MVLSTYYSSLGPRDCGYEMRDDVSVLHCSVDFRYRLSALSEWSNVDRPTTEGRRRTERYDITRQIRMSAMMMMCRICRICFDATEIALPLVAYRYDSSLSPETPLTFVGLGLKPQSSVPTHDDLFRLCSLEGVRRFFTNNYDRKKMTGMNRSPSSLLLLS